MWPSSRWAEGLVDLSPRERVGHDLLVRVLAPRSDHQRQRLAEVVGLVGATPAPSFATVPMRSWPVWRGSLRPRFSRSGHVEAAHRMDAADLAHALDAVARLQVVLVPDRQLAPAWTSVSCREKPRQEEAPAGPPAAGHVAVGGQDLSERADDHRGRLLRVSSGVVASLEIHGVDPALFQSPTVSRIGAPHADRDKGAHVEPRPDGSREGSPGTVRGPRDWSGRDRPPAVW